MQYSVDVCLFCSQLSSKASNKDLSDCILDCGGEAEECKPKKCCGPKRDSSPNGVRQRAITAGGGGASPNRHSTSSDTGSQKGELETVINFNAESSV